MKVFLVDNYDSFTYNLVHYIESIINSTVIVKRPPEVDIELLEQYDVIIFSPGPGLPSDNNLMCNILKKYYTSKIILGICLGHQAIGEFFGGKLINLNNVYHGEQHEVYLTDKISQIYSGLNHQFKVARYHSWIIKKTSKFNNVINITSTDIDNEIMSIEHKYYPIFGIQYHPESILTPKGYQILENFFNSLKAYN